jgi:acyl-CoA hydrolase
VIAQINPQMPRVLGDGMVHYSVFSAMVWHDCPIYEVDYASKSNEQTDRIGQYIAGVIEDGSTMQMGVGGVPDAVLKCLTNHKGLGVHTEMFSDGILPLVEKGIITNEHKKIQRGKIVTAFVLGTRKIYDFVDNNPDVNCMEISFVNDTSIIRQNPRVVAINSAIEVDLTGQVCSDSIGAYQYSGIGGQMDFIRGACLSENGQPIIALPSVTNKGVSRIVPFLKPGAGVVTTRGHIHWVATEFGIVNLYGKNLKQRAKLLISIAHPDHREELEKAYWERFQKHSVSFKTLV